MRRTKSIYSAYMDLVMVMGMGIPGGYTGKGTTGTDKDTYFGIRPCTRTLIRHTRTRSCGFALQRPWDFPNQGISIKSYYYIMIICYNSVVPYQHRTNIFFPPFLLDKQFETKNSPNFF